MFPIENGDVEPDLTVQERQQRLKVTNWAVHDIVGALESRDGLEIFIPSFQRGICWSLEKQLDLIKSIKRGFPIGSLLLFKENPTRYELVDGLQRATTLREYEHHKFKYFIESDVPTKLIDAVISSYNLFANQALSEIDKDIIRTSVRIEVFKWVRSLSGFSIDDGFSVTGLLERLSGFGLRAVTAANLVRKFHEAEAEKFVTRLKASMDISTCQIPVVEYSGPREYLPEIFERLNDGGVKLNKFDLLAATWSDKMVASENSAIREATHDRFKDLKKSGLQRVPGHETSEGGKIELFDFVFGLGRVLTLGFPLLFKPSRAPALPDSAGFNIVGLCLGLRLSDLAGVPQQLARFPSADEFFDEVMASVEIVNDALRALLELRLQGEARMPIYHTEFQIASMVAAVFHRRLDPTESAVTLTDLQTNLTQWYLVDIMRSAWKGSGDSKAVEYVKSKRYDEPISAAVLADILGAWFSTEHLTTQRRTFDQKSQLLLKYLYNSQWEFDDATTEHDLQPTLDISILARQGFPGNIVSNVVLIDRDETVDPFEGSGVAEPGNSDRDAIENFLRERFHIVINKIAEGFAFQNA